MTWRRWLAAVAFALASLAGAYVAGRASAPAKLEERERIVYQDRVRVERVVEQAQAKSTEAATNTRVITRYVKITTPDGGTREEAHTDTAAATATKAAESSSSSDRLASERDTFLDQSREKVITRTEPADYGVTALVGWDRLHARPNVGGLLVERRIIGGVSIGAWATSELTGGLAVGFRW